MNPLTFIPPPFAGVPSITIEFCDRFDSSVDGNVLQTRLHRATWVQTELFLTFPPPILRGITLLPLNSPETGGRFRVWLRWSPVTSAESETATPAPTPGDVVLANELLWDRKVEGSFPELKVL
ncbi:hypothetical protein FRB90_005483, partial [Tulasnella sp. 427]